MAAEVVYSNSGLKDRLQSLFDAMQIGHSLRLYVNTARPTPAWTIKQFTEASYPGYARVNLAGLLLPIYKVVDGCWEFRSKEIVFQGAPGADEVIGGWFIVTNGQPVCSARLPVLYRILGTKKLTLRVVLQATSTSLLSPL